MRIDKDYALTYPIEKVRFRFASCSAVAFVESAPETFCAASIAPEKIKKALLDFMVLIAWE